jgi:hypothetical protein
MKSITYELLAKPDLFEDFCQNGMKGEVCGLPFLA